MRHIGNKGKCFWGGSPVHFIPNVLSDGIRPRWSITSHEQLDQHTNNITVHAPDLMSKSTESVHLNQNTHTKVNALRALDSAGPHAGQCARPYGPKGERKVGGKVQQRVQV